MKLLDAVIINTKDWTNHWFEGKEGEVVRVRKYPYKTCVGGYIDYCSCVDCVVNRAGKQMYDAYEVVDTGSIIPVCCLEFDGI